MPARICVLTLLCLAALASAQDYYRFDIDQDRVAGAPDFSFLNHPLGPEDRLFVRDGHFYRLGPDRRRETADDERVRLFGVNLAFSANFPDEADAARVARRLRRMGVNLVRLHHMDSDPEPGAQPRGDSILTTGPYPTLNAPAITRLRRFLDALKVEGIYANLNLHVGYEFSPAKDGVPAMPSGAAIPSQSKPLHIFHPRMVELQTSFARKVIEALSLQDDPVLGLVEINNESSLLSNWQATWETQFDQAVAGEYREELKRQWNAYLAARYASTAALQTAWGAGMQDGSNILPSAWAPLELHGSARATLVSLSDGSVRIDIQAAGNTIILKKINFSVSTERPYFAEVELRADLPAGASGTVYWDIKRDVSPWDTLKGQNVTVTRDWQKFSMMVPATFAMDGVGRFGLSLENVGASVYVRNASLRQAGETALAPGESLEGRSVSTVLQDDRTTTARLNDWLLFLADRDAAYLATLAAAVRETAGPLVPVTGTQVNFGGLLNLDSHQGMDYDDSHFYVDHYEFPGSAWDGRDWRIQDTSGVRTGLWDMTNLAGQRSAGRPFTVSEFNQNWPNRQAAELDPIVAIFAAFQDWDGLMHFAYAHGRDWDINVPNGFNLNGDWTKWAGFGQAAWLFRTAALPPGPVGVPVPMPQDLRLRSARERRGGDFATYQATALGINRFQHLRYRTALAKDSAESVPQALRETPAKPYRSLGDALTYDPDAGLLLAQAPQVAAVIGQAGSTPRSAGAVTLELAPSARGFASLLVTSLDNRPLEHSTRILVSHPGATLRTQPQSNPARPQQLVAYGAGWTAEREPAYPNKPSGDAFGGQKPVWMERIEAYLTLQTTADAITVYPLDGNGARLEPLAAASYVTRAGEGFRIHLQASGQTGSPWYEIVADQRGAGRSPARRPTTGSLR